MNRSQTILITGATSGIGRAAALHFAKAGARVVATGRNPKALAELAVEASGDHLIPLRLDVTSSASIEAVKEEVFELTEGRGIDVLINNAGYGVPAPMTEVDPDDLRRQFETNVFGLVEVTRAFVPAMQARRAGTVINVSSVGGRISFPFFGPYTGSKHAVEGISDALRMELRPFGVRVVVIEPGPIDTGFADTTMGILDRYRDGSSAYAPMYAKADAIRARSDRMAAGPEVVVRAMERAIRARRPAARYVVPFSSRLFVALRRLVPTRAFDAATARLLGLTPKALARDPAQPQLASESAQAS